MKHQFTYFAGTILSLGMLSGCVSTHNSVESPITLTPAVCRLAADSNRIVAVNTVFVVPADYMKLRSRLVVTPQLMVGDSVCHELLPLVMDAPIYSRKMLRREKLEGYQDTLSSLRQPAQQLSEVQHWSYRDSFVLPEGLDQARLMAVVTADGCGLCSSIDTIPMGGISNPVSLMEPAWRYTWIEPQFVIRPKIMKGEGVAHLQFAINRHDINLDLGNNRGELDAMVRTLGPVLQDSLATLTSLQIDGMASADGSLAFNTTLSRNRAQSAKHWLTQQFHLPASVSRLIRVGSRPEGWEPVLEAMKADKHPDTLQVEKILDRYADANDDVQERHIRRLPVWNTLCKHYLQKDRKVVYAYTYTLRSFTTDAEMLSMYKKRPDAFNEEEFLRVASLMNDCESRTEVYHMLVQHHPESVVGNHNLAILYLQKGEAEKAYTLLSRMTKLTPELRNVMAVAAIECGKEEEAQELLKGAASCEDARFNQGVLLALQGKPDQAYPLLRPFRNEAAAIAALLVNALDDAESILKELPQDQPKVAYLRCLVAARRGDSEVFFIQLRRACEDQNLQQRALNNPEIDAYRKDPRFASSITPDKNQSAR